MKRLPIAFLLIFIASGLFAQKNTGNDLVQYVNVLMGTDSKYQLSNGNTYPAVALPWGMNFWSAQTNVNGNGWMYQYSADKIRGLKQTHQPSPWINDYGQFSLMPVNKMVFDEEHRASWFSHKSEIATPYYYSVYLSDHHVTASFTPTERCAQFQFQFQKDDSAFVVVDAFDKGSYIKIIPEENAIMGYTTRNSGGVPDNFKNYFIIRFNQKFQTKNVWHDKSIAGDSLEYAGNHAGAIVSFANKTVVAKVASSFISFEQASLNMQREIGIDDFETTKHKAKQIWNNELNKIKVEDDNQDHIKNFYSCLYRVMLFPRKFYEMDANSNVVHYSPYNGKVLPGYMFTDNGFWDTFRAVFPFLSLMYPELDAQIMQGLVNTYKESGWLPEWASPGHRDCMIGSNSASIIADAYVKGIRGFDANTLYEAVKKNSESEGPLTSVGRKGAKYYNELGYVPYDVGIDENAARTLEYAYADFAIAQFGKALHKPITEVGLYEKRSMNYKNVFDDETKLMRGKLKSGVFTKPFNAFKWGDAFTEGNAWHYTWSVFHDVEGLKQLMGGDKMMIAMLDSVFALPPVYDASYYGQVIHEITEMAIAGMGQYAHGNQPIQHMIYLYNYTSQPWKAQYWLREVLTRLYKAQPDGYCGDEDNGQTSAWYVFSALGFYPVCPGTTQYVMGAPLFKKVTIKMPTGKTLVIGAPKNSTENRYINNVQWNGKPYNKNWFDHNALQQGGTIIFHMQPLPEKGRGNTVSVQPFSMSVKD